MLISYSLHAALFNIYKEENWNVCLIINIAYKWVKQTCPLLLFGIENIITQL